MSFFLELSPRAIKFGLVVGKYVSVLKVTRVDGAC